MFIIYLYINYLFELVKLLSFKVCVNDSLFIFFSLYGNKVNIAIEIGTQKKPIKYNKIGFWLKHNIEINKEKKFEDNKEIFISVAFENCMIEGIVI